MFDKFAPVLASASGKVADAFDGRAASLGIAILVLIVVLPVVVLFVQVAAAALPRRRSTATTGGRRPRVAVLMPAHNEADVIVATLDGLLPQMTWRDRVLVIADNCSDETAALAAAAGAHVAVRQDASRRGKSYALEFGIRQLAADAPEVVIIIDADCQVEPGTIDKLARECAASGRPVQGLYLMSSPAANGMAGQVAEFAWIVKNWVRPLGLRRLGLACQLMGTGTAFPWPVIERCPIANAELAEDYKLGIDLALGGHAPRFLPEARVTSEFPMRADAVRSQRTRWEHGHLNLVLRHVPLLVGRALLRGDRHLLAMALDMGVPPLAFLALLVVGGTALTALVALLGGPAWPLAALLLVNAAFAAAVLVAWRGWGRHALPALSVRAITAYALAKIPLYLRFATRRQRVWLKTERDKAPAAARSLRASSD